VLERSTKNRQKKGGLLRKSRFNDVKKRLSGDKSNPAESLDDADDFADEGDGRDVHGAMCTDDMPKPQKHFGRFDELSNSSDDEVRGGQSQDMGQLGKEVSTIARQVGFLTEVVCSLREDVAVVRQHLDMKDVNVGKKLLDREDSSSNGAVSLVSGWTPLKPAECLSASSSIEQPPEANRDAAWSERAREWPPNIRPGGPNTAVHTNL